MTPDKVPDRYGKPMIIIHWLMAVALVLAWLAGVRIWLMPWSPARFQLIAWHKWLGISILLLLVIRLLLRSNSKTPPLPAHMSSHERLLAHAGHLLLYLLMLLVPLSGWAMSSAYGIPVVYLGILPLPDLMAANPLWASRLQLLHQSLNLLLAFAIVGHVLAALKHHLVDHDGLLHRMWIKR